MLPEAIEMLGLAGLPVTVRMQDDWWNATRGKPLTLEGQKRVAMALANDQKQTLTFFKPYPRPTRGAYRTPTAEGWRLLASYWANQKQGTKRLPQELQDVAVEQIRVALDLICEKSECGDLLKDDVLASICLHEADLCER